eukprot:COSAG04_NODE_561_length_12576_cov_258.320910_4_plen_198_part_00
MQRRCPWPGAAALELPLAVRDAPTPPPRPHRCSTNPAHRSSTHSTILHSVPRHAAQHVRAPHHRRLYGAPAQGVAPRGRPGLHRQEAPALHPAAQVRRRAERDLCETRRWNSNKSAGLGNTAAGAVSKDVGKALLNSYKSPGRCAPARPMASHHPLRLSQSIGCWRVGAWWLVAGQQGGDGWALLPQWATGGWVLEV